MAEMVSSAIVGEAVGRIFSGITSKDEDKSDKEGGVERLEMARIKMEAALETSNKWQITDASLLHWRKKLKRAAQDCDDAARRCRQLSLEENEMAEVARQSSLPWRVAHATKAFISSFVGRSNDHCSTSSAAVRRFERLADGASEFMRFVQLGGTPRQHLFFDPLIRHVFDGKSILYQVLHPGGQYHYFGIRPVGFEERGLEAMLAFIYEDKVPKNSFRLGFMLRLSESTDIIGTTVKCLQLMTPHFKSTAEVVIREITQLPTQDFSCLPPDLANANMEQSNQIYRTFTGWFRPDPLCCKGYEHDVPPSCGGSSSSTNKLRLSSIFPEPVCKVFLQRHISLSEYKNMQGSTTGYDTSSLENSPPLKLGILFGPHDSLEDPKSTGEGSAIEAIDGEKQHLTHVNVHPDQLDEMLLPKAIDYLHDNAEATTYQVYWRSKHGSAHLCVEKTSTITRMLGARRGTRQGRNKSNKVLRQKQIYKRQWEQIYKRQWEQVARDFLKLWAVRSSDRLQSSFTAWLKHLGQN